MRLKILFSTLALKMTALSPEQTKGLPLPMKVVYLLFNEAPYSAGVNPGVSLF
jgi:hypothetical protein